METRRDETRPVSVSATKVAGKVGVGFDMDSYEVWSFPIYFTTQLHQALLNACLRISSQVTQILSLEAVMAQAAATSKETPGSPENGLMIGQNHRRTS